jgi:hypothetical protein
MKSGLQINDEPLVKLGHKLLCLFFAAYDFDAFYRESSEEPSMRDPTAKEDTHF